LREYNLFESVEESRKREEVLGKLNVIVKEWVRQVSVQKVLCAALILLSLNNANSNYFRVFLNRLLLRLELRYLLLDPIGLGFMFQGLILTLCVLVHDTLIEMIFLQDYTKRC
jgi:hypothetical protein